MVTQAGLGFSSQIEDTWCSLTLWGPWAPREIRTHTLHARPQAYVRRSNAAYNSQNSSLGSQR